jgi:hypothetical protein
VIGTEGDIVASPGKLAQLGRGSCPFQVQPQKLNGTIMMPISRTFRYGQKVLIGRNNWLPVMDTFRTVSLQAQGLVDGHVAR